MATVTNYNPYYTNGTSAYGCDQTTFTDSDGYTYQKYTPTNDAVYYYPEVTAIKRIVDNNTIKILYKIILGDGNWVYYNYTKLGSDSFTISSNMTKDNKLYYFICGCGGNGKSGEHHTTTDFKAGSAAGGGGAIYSNNSIDLSANTTYIYNTQVYNNPNGTTSSITQTSPTDGSVSKSAANGGDGTNFQTTFTTATPTPVAPLKITFSDNLSNNAIFIGGNGGPGGGFATGSSSNRNGTYGIGAGGGGAGDALFSSHGSVSHGGPGLNGYDGGDSTRDSNAYFKNGGGGWAGFNFSQGGIGGGGGGGGMGYKNDGKGGIGGTGAIMIYYKKA
jgi:hypothetical protein